MTVPTPAQTPLFGKSLFSLHYLETRLPGQPEWTEDPLAAFDAVRLLWQKARRYGEAWNEAQTEDEFVKPVLAVLGWSYIPQVKNNRSGRINRPDYALFADEATKNAAYPHQGDDDPFYSRALAIAEAKYWGRPLSRKDANGRDTWKTDNNPSHQMVSYLVGTRCPWGILTNGPIWRLYSREVSSTASEFYEVDLDAIFGEDTPSHVGAGPPRPVAQSITPSGSHKNHHGVVTHRMGEETYAPTDAFRRWWLFFRRAAFTPDSQGRTFVRRIHEGSATYAKRVSDKLKELVFDEVMPEIAGGFVAYRREQMGRREESDESLRQIYAAGLSLLYKLLFVLYAEARDLLPMRNPAYREQSLTSFAEWAAERADRGLPLSDATFATPRYEALLALFRRIDRGDASLGIPRYDGGLFNAATPDNQFLERHKLSDRVVARAVDIMVRDAGEPVDYAYLSVRNLGTIYEGLLENRLAITPRPSPRPAATPLPSPEPHYAQERGEGPGERGEVILVNDKGERKLTGSFYTPDFIVEYNVSQTLDPILDERTARFTAAMDRSAVLRKKLLNALDQVTNQRLQGQLADAERDAFEAFLGIKVCDSAMGSGHFLVNTVDHLTDGIILRMQTYHDSHPDVPWSWNPIQRLIERVRGEIGTEMARQGIPIDPARLDDTSLLTRLVMKRCIYGVDLNPLAVELAKLSLWLHTFTVGAPLSFLDHHLRWGNSVIGADVRTVERAMRGEVRESKATAESRRLAEARGEAPAIPAAATQFGLFQGPFAGLLDLTAVMIEVAERSDTTLADVQGSAEAYAAFQSQLLPYKQALDLWVSQWFDEGSRSIPVGRKTKDQGPAVEFMTMRSGDVLPALRGEIVVDERYGQAIARARDLWERQRFFHWDLEFPEVFVDLAGRDWAVDGGFDAMIGNPPYVRQEQVSAAKRYLAAAHAPVYDASADLYVYFYHRGCEMLRRGGRLAYIVSNKWLRAGYGEPLRRYLAEHVVVESIVDFGHAPIFPDADTFPCVAVLCKPDAALAAPAETEVCAFPREELGRSDLTDYVVRHSHHVPASRFSAAPWSLEPPEVDALMAKMKRAGVALAEYAGMRPLAGIKTGLNEAYLIDGETKSRLVAMDPRLAEYVKPYLRGRDIKRWHPTWAGLWIILLKSSGDYPWPWANFQPSQAEAAFRTTYPVLYEFMGQWQDKLKERTDKGRFWWELRSCAYYEAFDRQNILYQDLAFHSRFAISEPGAVAEMTCFCLPSSDKWLLAVLNSPLMWAYMSRTVIHGKDEVLRLKTIYVEQLPIVRPSDSERSLTIEITGRLIELARQEQRLRDEVLAWLAAEFDVTTPGQALEAFAHLEEGPFVQQVRARRPKREARLSPAAVGELTSVYRQYVPSLRAGAAETARLEGRLTEIVNAAYGLTPEEIALLWRTAPPRMPVSQAAG